MNDKEEHYDKEEQRRYWRDKKREYRNRVKETSVVFSHDQERKLMQAAKTHNMAFQEYVRNAALAYTNKTFLQMDPNLIQDMILQTRAIGNLLNQAVRQINIRKNVTPEDVIKLRELVFSFEDVVVHTIRNPPELEGCIKNKLACDPDFARELESLIAHYKNGLQNT